MLLNQKMQSLAVVAFFSSIAITLATQTMRESICCKEVSTREITVPVVGFMIMSPRPPCVKAVIFFTSEGAVCSHWKEDWVKQKVMELRRLQALEKKNNSGGEAPMTESTTANL